MYLRNFKDLQEIKRIRVKAVLSRDLTKDKFMVDFYNGQVVACDKIIQALYKI